MATNQGETASVRKLWLYVIMTAATFEVTIKLFLHTHNK